MPSPQPTTGWGLSIPSCVEAALEHLNALSAAERPVLFFNHPAAGQWSTESINRYLAADGAVGSVEAAALVVGIEALHGHQAHAKVAAMDPCAYPGGAVGGLVDQVYACQRPFSLLLNSDFHVHKQRAPARLSARSLQSRSGSAWRRGIHLPQRRSSLACAEGARAPLRGTGSTSAIFRSMTILSAILGREAPVFCALSLRQPKRLKRLS